MVEFIRSVNPGASPVANLSNRYFRPQLDDRESRALGQLANAMARKRGALGGLADSYGALGSKFQQLSNAATSYQQDRLRDLQRQYDTQNRRDQLALDQEQNQFRVAAEKQRLMLAEAQASASSIEDQLNVVLGSGFDDTVDRSLLGISVAGNAPVTSNPFSGSVNAVGPTAQGFTEQYGPQLQSVAQLTGANLTVSEASVANRSQLADLAPSANLDVTLNNPTPIGGLERASGDVQDRMQNVFGTSGNTPKFRSVEDGVRYLGFWAQHNGVAEGTVDQAVRRMFGLLGSGSVEATKGVTEETISAYRNQMQMLTELGLNPTDSIASREARAVFVQGVTQETLGTALSGDLPVGKLFDEGETAYKTGRLVRNNAGQFKVFKGDRDEYGPLQDGERRVSLDFNSADGITDGFYAMVVVPDNATGEERQAASSYARGMVKLMADYGYDDYGLYGSDGVRTTSENGRGKANTFHTEPFFAQDERAMTLLDNPEFLQDYADLLKSTLGEIDGAVMMAPHTAAKSGAVMTLANGTQVSERDFALQSILPLLDGPARKQHLVDITADDGTSPIVMSGDTYVAEALAGMGVPVNNGSAQDILSVGAGGDVADPKGLPTRGLNATAGEPLTPLQELTAEYRQRVQLAVQLARESDNPVIAANPEQFVQSTAGYRRERTNYMAAVEDLRKAEQESQIERFENDVKDVVAQRTPSALAELTLIEETADFDRFSELVGDGEYKDLIVNLLSDGNAEFAEVLKAQYTGEELRATDVGEKVMDLAGKHQNVKRQRPLIEAAELAIVEAIQLGTDFNEVRGNHAPTYVQAAVQSRIDRVSKYADLSQANLSELTVGDVAELQKEKEFLNEVALHVSGMLNVQQVDDIRKVLEQIEKVQEPIVQAANLNNIALSESPKAALQAFITAKSNGVSFNLDREYYNEVGKAAANRFNELQQQSLEQGSGPIPTQTESLAWNTGAQQLERTQAVVDVDVIKKERAARLAGVFVGLDDSQERAAALQYASQLGLTGVGSQVMALAFATDPTLQLPEMRQSYDEIMQAMSMSGADPITMFSETQGLNMLVLMQMDGVRKPHAILRDVQRQISDVPSTYLDHVGEVNLAGVPMTMRNSVKAALLVDAVVNLGAGAKKEAVMAHLDKAVSGMVQSKGFGTLFNTGAVPATNGATSQGSTGLKIVTAYMKGEKPVAKDYASLVAASLAQHATPVLQDLNAERGPSQVKTDILAGGYNASISPDGAALTRGRQEEQVLDLGGISTSLAYNDRVTATLRPARVVSEAQDAVTGATIAKEKNAVFLDSEFYMDLSSLGSITVQVTEENGEATKLEIPVSELRPVVTKAGEGYVKTGRTASTPRSPDSGATVGYFFVLPDDVVEIVTTDIELDDIPMSSGLQAPVGINTRAIQEAYEAYQTNRYEVLVDG